MANELRFETLFQSVADGTTAENAGEEFRNDSASMIHIRELDQNGWISTGANDESMFAEVSKAPTRQAATVNGPFFVSPLNLFIAAGTTGSGADDVGIATHKVKKFGRGQLTLEPGESLFMNMAKSSGGSGNHQCIIAYEFA